MAAGDRGAVTTGPPPSARARIRRPVTGSVREVWPSEPRDFTPWLAENTDYLEVLGLGHLSVVAVEATLPDSYRALDILAETADERRVAIENQFGEADHDHLTRGLAYAVGHGAAALVVIAEAHRPEFVAIAQYLNRAAEGLGLDEGGIGVYLVSLSVERLDDWYLPRLELVEGPNRWLSETGLGRRGRLRSIEEFLAQVPPDRRETMRTIIEDWPERPGGSVTHNAEAAVALRIPKPVGPGTVAALTAHNSGTMWVNRGYLVAAFEPAGLTEVALDDLIRVTLPSARAGEKNYYLTIAEPDVVAYRAFADGLWRLRDGLEPQAGA